MLRSHTIGTASGNSYTVGYTRQIDLSDDMYVELKSLQLFLWPAPLNLFLHFFLDIVICFHSDSLETI